MTVPQDDEPGRSLITTLENPEFVDAVIEAGDMSIETLTDALVHVPILKWVVAAGKTVSSVRDYFFVKRMAAFLSDFKALPAAERAGVIHRLDHEPEYAERAAEAVIMILDRVDSSLKATWVSRALRAYAAHHINATQLMRINAAIERMLTCDVEGIRSAFTAGPSINGTDPFAQAAISAGLAFSLAAYGGSVAAQTETYQLFVQYLLD